MSVRRIAAAVAVALGLGACAAGPVPPLPDGSTPMDWRDISQAGKTSPEAFSNVLSDTTSTIYLLTGTRVQYLASDGRLFVWLPGTGKAALGRWRVKSGLHTAALCLTIFGSEECEASGRLVGLLHETVKGDVFGLSDGTAPFVMPQRRAMSLNRLMQIENGTLSLDDFQ